MLRKEGTFKKFLIPTAKLDKFQDIELNLNKFNNEIIIKPNLGSYGKGVLKLHKKDNNYFLLEGIKEKKFNFCQLQDYYNKNLDIRKYVIQPFIICKTLEGKPFDIHIHAKRGSDGEFAIICYPRIGSSKGVVSNISSGGSTMELNKFLQREFGEQYKAILDKLNEFGETFVHYYQSFFTKKLFNLGIDVAIQKKYQSF